MWFLLLDAVPDTVTNIMQIGDPSIYNMLTITHNITLVLAIIFSSIIIFICAGGGHWLCIIKFQPLQLIYTFVPGNDD